MPNYEVAKAFQMALKTGEWGEISKAISRCDELQISHSFQEPTPDTDLQW